MKKYTLFLFLFFFSCTKEESQTFELIDKLYTTIDHKPRPSSQPEKYDSKFTEKMAFKRWQNAMSTLNKITNDSLLKFLCILSKDAKLINQKEAIRRSMLTQIGLEESFPLGIYFNSKKDTTPPYFTSLYDPNTNIIMIYDYQNLSKFGSWPEISIAIVYSHEMMHYLGFRLGMTEEKEHEIIAGIERNVLYSFLPELRKIGKIDTFWNSSEEIAKNIDYEFGKYGFITTLLIKDIFLKQKILKTRPVI